MPLFGRRRRPSPAPPTQGRRPQFQLLHPLATGPIGLENLASSKPNLVHDHLRRTRPEFIWTCDDLSDLDVTVNRQFPTPAALVETAFANQAMCEHYHVKRDGVPSVMLLILEPTFNKIATVTKFRYLARHGADSNTSILVVREEHHG
jgi:hypothetical protein